MKIRLAMLVVCGLLVSGAQAETFTRVMVIGGKVQVQQYFALNADCSRMGETTLRVTNAPQHGTVAVYKTKGFPIYPSNNPRRDCNTRRHESLGVDYKPEAGFAGADYFSIEAFYSDGTERMDDYQIAVK